MTCGVDTDFLVAVEVREHLYHASANAMLDERLREAARFAWAPQTVAEFLHVVTDPRRLPKPLTMDDAIVRAENWWNAAEVLRVYPQGATTAHFFEWLREYRLGRKRLLDTMLASTFVFAGVRRIITNNEEDFRAFGVFELLRYGR